MNENEVELNLRTLLSISALQIDLQEKRALTEVLISSDVQQKLKEILNESLKVVEAILQIGQQESQEATKI